MEVCFNIKCHFKIRFIMADDLSLMRKILRLAQNDFIHRVIKVNK